MLSRSPLPEFWKVPPIFRQRIRESIGRQRVMHAEGHLLLVLHAPPKADEAQRIARLFWRSPDGVWQSTMGQGIAALQRHLAEYAAALERLDEAEDGADRAAEFFEILQEIAPLRRSARNLYETLQEARDVASDDSDLILCRDQAYALQRRAELVESDTHSGLDCAVARRLEEQAESSHRMAVSAYRLNLLAAVFFPIATISAVFGMNLPHGLGDLSNEPWFFWSLVLGGLFVGLFLKAALNDPTVAGKSRGPEEDLARLRLLDRHK
jgi:hypothetical protein